MLPHGCSAGVLIGCADLQWDPGALGELFSLTYTPFAHLIALGCRLLKCMAIPCWIWSPTLNLARVAGTHATHLVLVNLALQDDRSYPCHLGTGPEPVGKNVLRIGNLGNVGNLQRIVGAFSRGLGSYIFIVIDNVTAMEDAMKIHCHHKHRGGIRHVCK